MQIFKNLEERDIPINLDTLLADKVGFPIVYLGAGHDGLIEVHRGEALEN